MRVLCFCSLLCALFVGCSSDVTKKTPEISTPTQWQSVDPLIRSNKNVNLPLLAWWQTFQDPELSQLIKQALKNNNDIQMATGNVLAAQGQLEQVEYAWIPSISAVFGRANTNANMLNSGYNLGFIPSYSFNFLSFIRSKEWAKANVSAAEAAKDAVKLTVIGQTVASYFTYLSQIYILKQQLQWIDDLQVLLTLSHKQYEQGLISLYTLQQYEQQYRQATAELPLLKHNIIVTGNALKLLLNENPGVIKSNAAFMRLKNNNIIPVDLPSQVLKNRPDVRAAEEQLIAAHANIDIASATFFPTISLTGAAASSSDSLSGLFSSQNDFWHYQMSLNMPLLDPTIYGQIKQAKGQYNSAYAHYIQTVRIAFQSVDNDLSAHQQYYASFIEQTKNWNSVQKTYDLAKLRYQKGLYSYPTLLNNKIMLDQATIALAKAKLAQLLTIVQLYQDLGGGYKDEG